MDDRKPGADALDRTWPYVVEGDPVVLVTVTGGCSGTLRRVQLADDDRIHHVLLELDAEVVAIPGESIVLFRPGRALPQPPTQVRVPVDLSALRG